MLEMDTSQNQIIQVNNLTVVFRDIPALWDVSFELPKGKMTAIVGPNGAGKSTLLRAILGLLKIRTGEIVIAGQSYLKVKNKHELIAYVPQRETVDWDFPINVLDVVMMGRYAHLGWFKRPNQETRQLAMEALKRFEMDGYADRQIGELSGGQKQRVFLARAYVQNAEIYFLDEPFGGGRFQD